MADVEITLNNSGESVTYRGYVINSCDNSKVDDGSWSPTLATGMTVNASESNITITHNNTSTSDVSSTFTWTSSLVSGCTKTLKVTVLGSANYKFYRHESTLVEISSISVTHKVDPNRTYNLNDIIRFGYYACAESPNDNSVSASLLTVSNLYIDRYFSSSSLVINDNDGEPSGCFYIGVKCNTKDLVKLFNDFTAFSAKFKFNLSYSNASIPVTIDIIKDKVAQYVIIFKKGNSTIESVELKQMPIIYAFNVYYRPKNSFEEQSASGIITSVSSSSTYYTATFNGNTVKLEQKIGSIGDVVPDDIEFDVRVCIKPSGASSDICNSLPVHFTKESSGGSSKSITINWSVSYPDGLMIYNYNTSIDVGLTNYVNSDATSGSVSEDFAPNITSRNISVNFSLKSAGYLGSIENKYKGKSVKVLIDCSGFMTAN